MCIGGSIFLHFRWFLISTNIFQDCLNESYDGYRHAFSVGDASSNSGNGLYLLIELFHGLWLHKNISSGNDQIVVNYEEFFRMMLGK